MDKELFWAAVRLVLSLPLVIVLAYLTIKYGLARRQWLFPGARRRMRVLEQLSLGPRTGLSLIQVGREYFLIAFHDGKITLVKEFTQLPEELPVVVPERENYGREQFFQEKINFFRQKFKRGR